MGEGEDDYRGKKKNGQNDEGEEGMMQGKKLVQELLLKLVWQMSEHWELTPQTYYILHLCIDR